MNEQSIKKPEAAQRRTGTKEWAKDTVNIQLGCEQGCRYCYAKWMMVSWLKKCTAEQWLNPVIDNSAVDADCKNIDGVVMLPSTHDITPRNLAAAMTVLDKLLAAGNDVLIVSKPHWICITLLCERLTKYRNQIMFRFTIGSKRDCILNFWEPDAPNFKERLGCLQYAYNMRYRTSVSAEPYLDNDVTGLYCMCKPWITDSFWVGLLRDLNRRVDLTDVTAEQMEKFVNPLKTAQCPEMVERIYRQIGIEKLVRWKDSVREIIEK